MKRIILTITLLGGVSLTNAMNPFKRKEVQPTLAQKLITLLPAIQLADYVDLEKMTLKPGALEVLTPEQLADILATLYNNTIKHASGTRNIKKEQLIPVAKLLRYIEPDTGKIRPEAKDIFSPFELRNLVSFFELLGVNRAVAQEKVEEILDAPARYSQLEKFSANINPSTRIALKGVVLGSTSLACLTLLGHTVCHSCMEAITPTGLWAAASLVPTLAVGYGALRYLTPKNIQQDAVFSAAADIGKAGLFQFIEQHDADLGRLVRRILGRQVQSAVTMAQFIATLTEQQKALVAGNKLMLMNLTPHLIIPEVALLQSLTEEQHAMLYGILIAKANQHIKQQVAQFIDQLADHVDALSRKNKLFTAQFNPAVLRDEQAFVARVLADAQVSAQFRALMPEAIA